MSENNEIGFAGAAGEASPGSDVTSEKTSEVVSAPSEPKPQFLTAEQFESEWEKRSKDLEERLSRKAQGLVDKSSSRLDAKVKELVETVENATGAQLTAQQKKAIRDEVVYKSLSEEPAPQPQVAQPKVEKQVDPVTTKALGILESFGLGEVDKNSPNIKLIDKTTTDPKIYLKSVKDFAAAEAQRLEAEKSKDNPTPEAQLPLGGGGAVAEGGITKRLNELLAHPKPLDPNYMKEVEELQERLHKLGS